MKNVKNKLIFALKSLSKNTTAHAKNNLFQKEKNIFRPKELQNRYKSAVPLLKIPSVACINKKWILSIKFSTMSGAKPTINPISPLSKLKPDLIKIQKKGKIITTQ